MISYLYLLLKRMKFTKTKGSSKTAGVSGDLEVVKTIEINISLQDWIIN